MDFFQHFFFTKANKLYYKNYDTYKNIGYSLSELNNSNKKYYSMTKNKLDITINAF